MLGAVEGLKVATSTLEHWVWVITIVILVVLFIFQGHGSARVGRVFGPIMVVWFISITVLGLGGIARYPSVLRAMNP